MCLEKQVCLLKDKTLKNLHSDLVGKLYKSFDPNDVLGTIEAELEKWLKDKCQVHYSIGSYASHVSAPPLRI